MATLFYPPTLVLLVILPCLSICSIATQTPQPYIIYMGRSSRRMVSDVKSSNGHDYYLQMLSSILPSGEKERAFLIHSYDHTFKGFSAMLTEQEASSISEHPEVVSVFKDEILPLHTTRSWDFLDEGSGTKWSRRHLRASRDAIVGIIDTGIWPESPSFSDHGIGKIPSRWKGVCMEGPDFKKSHCNRKLIGARFYKSRSSIPAPPNNTYSTAAIQSPRDPMGHGTHTASTAVGMPVDNASYYGLAHGTARGGSLSSTRLAMYKACHVGGCSGSSILKAIDDAVKDGVDVISISIGVSSVFQPDFLDDPIAIGAFHADEHGVLVVCSGGNDGPIPSTVVNSAPWILTVAASTIDRSYQSDVVLGNGHVVKGSAITFSNSKSWKKRRIVFGGDIAGEFTPKFEASNCYPGSLDHRKAKGKIVLCLDSDPSVSRRVKKLVAQGAGARGTIIIDESEKGSPFDSRTFPFSEIGKKDGDRILNYINSTRKPVAAILPSKDVNKVKPAPIVASFSARGPGGLTQSILKPDIMAPGVGIMAAWIPVADAADIPRGFTKPSSFAVKSGTSMASPHVAGAAALIKSLHPRWTPSMIRSALMTTATTWNNVGKPLTTTSASGANLHDTGAGEISPLRAINPGLVFETTTTDYLSFLCYYGYDQRLVSSISNSNFTCPSSNSTNGDGSLPISSSINYPSISIAKLDGRRGPTKVVRKATNVGQPNATYVASVEAPEGLKVKVWPERLVFGGVLNSEKKNNERKGKEERSFEVWFDGRKVAKKGYCFGAVTWWDGLSHWSRLVFAVNVV